MEKSPAFTNIDQYILQFPPEVQERLRALRAMIRECAPEATEKIAYGMPTFFLHENLIHFAGYAKHIGVYPTPSGVSEFQDELKGYKNAKGSVQFPLSGPLPMDLLRRITLFRVDEVQSKAASKKKKK